MDDHELRGVRAHDPDVAFEDLVAMARRYYATYRAGVDDEREEHAPLQHRAPSGRGFAADADVPVTLDDYERNRPASASGRPAW